MLIVLSVTAFAILIGLLATIMQLGLRLHEEKTKNATLRHECMQADLDAFEQHNRAEKAEERLADMELSMEMLLNPNMKLTPADIIGKRKPRDLEIVASTITGDKIKAGSIVTFARDGRMIGLDPDEFAAEWREAHAPQDAPITPKVLQHI